MVSHALERHEGANRGKTWAETLRKSELWWKMDNAQLFKSFEFGNGSRMSDKNLVILEFKAGLLFFISFLFFHQMIAFQKLEKMFFISSKKLFTFLRCSNICIFSLPFHTFQIQKDKWSGIIYDVMN